MDKFIKSINKDIKRNYKFYLVLLLFLLLFVIRLDYYVYSPGGLIDLTDRVNIENSFKQKGSFNMTYVSSRNGNIVNLLLSLIIPNWDIESVDEMRIDDEDVDEIETRDRIKLEESSSESLIAAFTEANIPYTITSTEVKVTYVFSSAKTNLKANDIIKSIEGTSINNYDDLTNVLDKHKVGDKINIKVLRDNKERDCYSTLISLDDKTAIGIGLIEMKNVETNPKVDFVYKNNESGSSRGLMCALEIYNKITEFDLTKGRVISGTGTIREDGSVGAIGGVKYKLLGAAKEKASIFLVPSDNYEEAMKIKKENNLKIEIIEADNLHNVIEKLK